MPDCLDCNKCMVRCIDNLEGNSIGFIPKGTIDNISYYLHFLNALVTEKPTLYTGMFEYSERT